MAGPVSAGVLPLWSADHRMSASALTDGLVGQPQIQPGCRNASPLPVMPAYAGQSDPKGATSLGGGVPWPVAARFPGTQTGHDKKSQTRRSTEEKRTRLNPGSSCCDGPSRRQP